MRYRSHDLTSSGRLVRPGLGLVALAALVLAGCAPDLEHMPDEVLRRELGLTDADRVYTFVITGGASELALPTVDSVPAGAWVQFVSGDWLVHEVSFEADSLDAAQRDFLERTDQLASPPLLHQDARFVVSLEDAPLGRYPFLLQGNVREGRGVLVVVGSG